MQSKVLEVYAIASVALRGAPVGKEGADPGEAAWSEDPLGHMQRRSCLAWNALGRGDTANQWTKDPGGLH